eukprot:727862-Rhodomonas_salina.1
MLGMGPLVQRQGVFASNLEVINSCLDELVAEALLSRSEADVEVPPPPLFCVVVGAVRSGGGASGVTGGVVSRFWTVSVSCRVFRTRARPFGPVSSPSFPTFSPQLLCSTADLTPLARNTTLLPPKDPHSPHCLPQTPTPKPLQFRLWNNGTTPRSRTPRCFASSWTCAAQMRRSASCATT